MKKFLLALSLVIFLPGCGDKGVDITQTDFEYEVNVCDEYFELLDCIIKKDNNETYTPEMREELRWEIKLIQEQWKYLSEDELTKKCSEEKSKFDDIHDDLKSLWCVK